MTEVHRYRIVKMISEGGNRISYDPYGPEVVMADAYDQLKTENDALRKKADCVDDCAHLIKKLVHCRRQLATDEGLATKALDYLKRKGLQGSPLRVEDSNHD
ncbi:hypothetical protein [Pseudomonas soli]|uniref:hypothetical protein n=1 Tax=Pseudomonas soli TaxID=1306993 RepID=UPI00299EB582|nr:hypothetical protein [Pseudomonas soli]MDW9406335.1 hypothetical protein [Pseudomonas soli]